MQLFPPELRRRGSLAPLEVSEESVQRDNFGIYVSPCEFIVSNDPLSPDDLENLNPCNTTLYECYDESGISAASAFSLDISFDYEVHYRKGADRDRVIEFVEGAILEHLASILLDCYDPDDRRWVRHLSWQFTQTELDRVVAVGSEPADRPDPIFEECTIPVDPLIQAASTCQPLNGYMTAFLDPIATPQERTSIESNMKLVVKSGMLNDVYVSGIITKVSYIGNRPGSPSPSPPPTPPISAGGNNRGIAIGGAVAGALALLLLLLLALYARRRKKRVDESLADLPHQDEEWHKRREGAIADDDPSKVPGSLASRDTLALEPQGGDTDDESFGGSSDGASTPSPRRKRPNGKTPFDLFAANSQDSADDALRLNTIAEESAGEDASAT